MCAAKHFVLLTITRLDQSKTGFYSNQSNSQKYEFVALLK